MCVCVCALQAATLCGSSAPAAQELRARASGHRPAPGPVARGHRRRVDPAVVTSTPGSATRTPSPRHGMILSNTRSFGRRRRRRIAEEAKIPQTARPSRKPPVRAPPSAWLCRCRVRLAANVVTVASPNAAPSVLEVVIGARRRDLPARVLGVGGILDADVNASDP